MEVGNGYPWGDNLSNAITTLVNGQTTLTNRYWTSSTPAVVPGEYHASAGEALVVEGHAELKGNATIEGTTTLNDKVILAQPQGISPWVSTIDHAGEVGRAESAPLRLPVSDRGGLLEISRNLVNGARQADRIHRIFSRMRQLAEASGAKPRHPHNLLPVMRWDPAFPMVVYSGPTHRLCDGSPGALGF